jgi:hypothetical protein
MISHQVLFANSTERHENLLFLWYRSRDDRDVIKGLRERERERGGEG